MNPVDMINEMTQKMMEQMPEPVRQLSEQAQQQMKTAMHKNLERMNLVSREEFEAQVLLLEKPKLGSLHLKPNSTTNELRTDRYPRGRSTGICRHACERTNPRRLARDTNFGLSASRRFTGSIAQCNQRGRIQISQLPSHPGP